MMFDRQIGTDQYFMTLLFPMTCCKNSPQPSVYVTVSLITLLPSVGTQTDISPSKDFGVNGREIATVWSIKTHIGGRNPPKSKLATSGYFNPMSFPEIQKI
ncbi:hypothetical protein TNCV_2527381 [Trichonephila clavipes]|nr:hypothetical protein TNCV_2527381 [Trichonephila clavipes]